MGAYSARAVDGGLLVDLGCDEIGERFLSLVRILVHPSLLIFFECALEILAFSSSWSVLCH